VSRLLATPAERALREQKLCAAIRTVLECIGEDPDREGLLRTPARYAQALMWMTKGYEERLAGEPAVTITSNGFPLSSFSAPCL
jgi:GTP cyclohydrolase I